MITSPFGNITRELSCDVSHANYKSDDAFFVRANTGGVLKYIPADNEDTEIITKTIEASPYFVDPVLVREIISSGTTATGIHVGWGV